MKYRVIFLSHNVRRGSWCLRSSSASHSFNNSSPKDITSPQSSTFLSTFSTFTFQLSQLFPFSDKTKRHPKNAEAGKGCCGPIAVQLRIIAREKEGLFLLSYWQEKGAFKEDWMNGKDSYIGLLLPPQDWIHQ